MWINKELRDYALSLKGDLVKFLAWVYNFEKSYKALYYIYELFACFKWVCNWKSYKNFIGTGYKNKE